MLLAESAGRETPISPVALYSGVCVPLRQENPSRPGLTRRPFRTVSSLLLPGALVLSLDRTNSYIHFSTYR